ncbi:MAG: CDP-alcohol phosphatidyltransferase [Bacteroidetes bacterium 24-39-8]|jgi:CDP-diacylglycerol--serine O-phosphatidyltransferase|nr:MAG: CDP-alcohol phosphatidyltransferase [Sphingobacteriia bacterium 35-40-8]OYZ51400.1 MAG: CDP-alcohol phosphatidyltransferase [Bacteroidetes bacterium 24-39-8]OZA64623.1 MAG: CDP-alcohol phosphatidyltransferase [Sphingobacteriia bacterium 39-39-8]HQR92381.1 CDP-alcohol phosphatidyltransferase family protein [Sediminibacterium sp.]HQS55440.1 CDP-alcohol phosphatidyltransferase family protein [Sediminibacterium sp.]
MKKQIPNLFTLANLFLGCMAIVQIMQSGLSLSIDASGENLVEIPEQMYLASILIAAAAVVDFFDGFVARLLKVPSEMGKQLDSLADVVSFGVAPGLIIYQFLRLSFAQSEGGLDVSSAFLLPAFIVPCAGAYRLARFNIDTEQSYGFKGVPIPAAGIWVASFPLVYWFAKDQWIVDLLRSYWFWYAVIGLSSYLMVSTLPMMAMKFKEFSLKALLPFMIIALVSLVAAILFGWLAVSIGFIAYVILSLLYK